MRHSIKRAGAARCFAYVSIAALLLISGNERTQAGDFHQPGVSGGTTATLGLRMPFGGTAPAVAQSTLALRFGSTWREAPGSRAVSGYRFVPAVEAGFTLRGEPAFRFGSFDIAASARAESSELEGRSFCVENPAICLIGAGLAVAGVGWAVSEATRGHNGPCLDGNGCD